MKRIIYLIICVGIFALLWGEKPATYINKEIPASGIYIAYIQSETLSGKYEKVLKLAIFQPEVRIGVD